MHAWISSHEVHNSFHSMTIQTKAGGRLNVWHVACYSFVADVMDTHESGLAEKRPASLARRRRPEHASSPPGKKKPSASRSRVRIPLNRTIMGLIDAHAYRHPRHRPGAGVCVSWDSSCSGSGPVREDRETIE